MTTLRSKWITARVLAAVCFASTACAADEMMFVSWGVAYQDGIRAAWIKPFTEQTGIAVQEDTNPVSARIKAMVDTQRVEWDVVTASGASLMQGAQSGLFEEITPAMVDESKMLHQARNDYGVPSEIFSTVIGYSMQAFPQGGSKTFADFFDVKNSPVDALASSKTRHGIGGGVDGRRCRGQGCV